MIATRGWSKVFGIGLSKTGTLSLHAAFEHLGLRSIHYPPAAEMVGGRFGILGAYDAACDISVSAYFRELDAAFPRSRFVLTVRERAGWIESLRAHMAARDQPGLTGQTPAGEIRSRALGSRTFNPAAHEAAYDRHVASVLAHFAFRPRDLLILNVCAGQGWSELCPFLGMPIPACGFPHRHHRKPVGMPVGTIEPAVTAVPVG